MQSNISKEEKEGRLEIMAQLRLLKKEREILARYKDILQNEKLSLSNDRNELRILLANCDMIDSFDAPLLNSNHSYQINTQENNEDLLLASLLSGYRRTETSGSHAISQDDNDLAFEQLIAEMNGEYSKEESSLF